MTPERNVFRYSGSPKGNRELDFRSPPGRDGERKKTVQCNRSVLSDGGVLIDPVQSHGMELDALGVGVDQIGVGLGV